MERSRHGLRVYALALMVLAAVCMTPHWRGPGVSAENAALKIASYKIDVQLKLDEKNHPTNLEGREQLTWRNDSPDTISELQFHLYLNAFKNEKSTFFRESGGQLRSDRFQAGEWGWIDVTEMKLAGGEDLTSRIEFIHPDDENGDDQTVIRVPLTTPIGPGEKVTLDLKFQAKLPRVFARTGYWGQFALVGQWFPKIGVWETAGARRRVSAGWNCHQFHANTEFYADFGDYDVTMTLPAIYRGKIGATGRQRSEKINNDGTVTYNFTQENVHDFAWTIDPNYLVVTRQFKPSEQIKEVEIADWKQRLGLPEDQIRLKEVDVTVVIQPEHRDQIDRHFTAAFNAIKYFGMWYGKYAYETLTIVDPPYNADGASGMEYPTLITAGTSWRAGRDHNPEEVIVHEYGHQYWQGMVATNEFEEAWLDEGFNTYSTSKVMKTAYGKNVIPFRMLGVNWLYLPFEIEPPRENRILTLRDQFNDPILTPAWKHYDSLSYGLNSYSRTGLVLNTLERYLGEEVMARVMREYHQKWRFRHPASEDFFETVNAVTRQDFTWFFDQFVKGTRTLDYEIAEIKSVRPQIASGFFDKDGQKVEIKEEANRDKIENRSYETEVTVRRVGEAYFPVDLLLKFQDGTTITAQPVSIRDGAIEYRIHDGRTGRQWTESWTIQDRWRKFKFTTATEISSAQVDPYEKVLLDANLTNNSKVAAATGVGGALRWGTGALYWVQAILQAVGAFGG